MENEQQLKPTRSIADLLPKEPKQEKPLRHQFIDEAVERINTERIGTPYPQVNAKYIAFRIAHLDDTDIHFFMKKCNESKSYSKRFFGMLKIK